MVDKRNLNADLELCKFATSGSWTVLHNSDEPTNAAQLTEICSLNFGKNNYMVVTDAPYLSDVSVDAKYIAESRNGWEYAINKAIETENILEQIKNTVNSSNLTNNEKVDWVMEFLKTV